MGREDRLPPSHKIRQETNSETSLYDTKKFTVLSHKIWSCKYMEDMYCDSDDGTSTRLTCEEAPRCMSMIWFSYNTSKSGDEQISMKETCRLCEGIAEQQLPLHCFQLYGW